MTSPSSAASGMSKREHFAAQAIAGLMTELGKVMESNGSRITPSIVGNLAVQVADALIEALNETETSPPD